VLTTGIRLIADWCQDQAEVKAEQTVDLFKENQSVLHPLQERDRP
jgi:hypothetical protein